MATSSIYHNVKLKNKKLCRGLICALENAQTDRGKEVLLSQRCQKVEKQDIQNFFKAQNRG